MRSKEVVVCGIPEVLQWKRHQVGAPQEAYRIWDGNLGLDAHSLKASRHKLQDSREAGLLKSILHCLDCRSLGIR